MSYRKRHLFNLPDLTEDQVPPRPTPSKRGIVLLPLFSGDPNFDEVASHVAISAVWAWNTWLRFTDADEYGVEVKFYVEEKARDSALPILERNFVEEADIIWHDNGHKLEGIVSSNHGWYTGGIKKAASYTDYRFQEYDWIFDVDADIFILSPNKEKMPFFRNFFEICLENTIGVCWPQEKPAAPPYRTPFDMPWCRDKKGRELRDWKARFEALAGREMLDRYFDPNQWFLTCNGGIVAFPAKHMMETNRKACEFLVSASRDLLDLEAALSLYHSFGNPLFDVIKKAGGGDIRNALLHIDSHMDGIQHFSNLFSEGRPFLLHYSTSYINALWHEGMT